MKEMWALVMRETPDIMRSGFDLRQERMKELKNFLLGLVAEALGKDYCSWACRALDKALDPQRTVLTLSPEGHISHGRPDL